MAGTSHAPAPAWTAVILMIIGFTLCTVAFVWHNNLPLWITGGVIGAVGVVVGRIYHVLDGGHEAPAHPQQRVDA